MFFLTFALPFWRCVADQTEAARKEEIMAILVTIVVYFALLLLIGRLTSSRGSNETFFAGERRSPWWMVAIGMIGASVSGVTFVSVPGMTLTSGMTYLQMCLGFIPGYLIVAFVLLPIYYKLGSPTIYSYLGESLGSRSYTTGAFFFMLSDMLGAAVRFYLVCAILQEFAFGPMGLSFYVTVPLMVALIYAYTRRGGIRTLVYTDVFQTLCMIGALCLIIHNVATALGLDFAGAVMAVAADERSRVFVMDDFLSPQNFLKQFVSGAFIVIVMTGLNQNMMQKNLTCKTLREAQKDMSLSGVLFTPVNLLFLGLGVLLAQLAESRGVPLPENGDSLLPMFAASGQMGQAVVVMFTIGVVAAAFSSVDSSLTALSTSLCVDIIRRSDSEKLRRRVHIAVAAVFVLIVFGLQMAGSKSLIDVVYTLASYTYGPLLGLFAVAMIARRRGVRSPLADRVSPIVATLSPILCYILGRMAQSAGYRFGYELLLLNAMITIGGLAVAFAIDKNKEHNDRQSNR